MEEVSRAVTVRSAESRNGYMNIILPGKVGRPFMLAATINAAGTVIQKAKAFNRGNAMSEAPIIRGTK